MVFLLLLIVSFAGCIENSDNSQNYRDINKSVSEQGDVHENPKPENDIYPEVWSMNGYDGQGYEYKVNCGSDYVVLETCFLWNLTNVIVVSPNGTEFELNKDFNINNYSGEVTRRWVLYGPVGGGLPSSGEYSFNYYIDDEIIFMQNIDYEPETIGIPKDIKWNLDGKNITVNWTPPEGMKPGMWYKVLLFQENGHVISDVFDWNANSARMDDLPLKHGDKFTLNVAAYFRGGYSYSDYFPVTFI